MFRGDGDSDDEGPDLDQRTRRQYLAILQYLQEHELIEALTAFERETKLKYRDGALPVASVLEESLDMFSDYTCRRPTTGIPEGGEEDEEALFSQEPAVCCTGESPGGPAGPFAANVLAVAWAAVRPGEQVVLVATADRRISVLGPGGEALAAAADLKSPALSLDAAPPPAAGREPAEDSGQDVLVTTMGGEVQLCRLHRPPGGASEPAGGWDLKFSQQIKDHTKHATLGRFAPLAPEPAATLRFLTISRDATARVYQRRSGADQFEAAGVVQLGGEVTSGAWIDPSSFLLAARGSHELHYWELGQDGSSLRESARANMNASGDAVVSFAVLALAVSPDRRLVAACTDKSRIIVFKTYTATQVRNLYGAVTDDYDVPSICFSLDHSFLYATSTLPQPSSLDRGGEEPITGMCGEVVVFEVQSGKAVLKLPCHERPVRCMSRHPLSEVLVTGSFDKAVKVWS